jgi:cytochrome bd-type quinol oxidase subunit 2
MLPEHRTDREEANMKRSPAIFLQVVVVLVGIAAIALLLWEPQIEGRNKHATLFEVYFQDPFLAYAYVASIPFFVAVVQAFKVLGCAGRHQVFSQAAVRSLRTIKRCAIAIVGFVAGAEVIILSHGNEDRAGGVFMGIVIAFASVVIATAAAVFERILQNAVDIKAENDLTV